jgi:hypothetical protein
MLQRQRDVAHEQLQPEALNIFHQTPPTLLMSSLVFLYLFLLQVQLITHYEPVTLKTFVEYVQIISNELMKLL